MEDEGWGMKHEGRRIKDGEWRKENGGWSMNSGDGGWWIKAGE